MSVTNSLPMKLIPFVLPSEESSGETINWKSSLSTGLSGTEASKFYDTVVSSICDQKSTKRPVNTSSVAKVLKKRKKSTEIPQSINLKSGSIFLYAQQGNLTGLKQCLVAGFSINQQDAYGWTPIMCAACDGHLSIVDYLLKLGANLEIKCKHGMTVMDIALKTKNSAVINLLQKGVDTKRQETSSEMLSCNDQETEKFCNDCKAPYKTSLIVHERSIPHLLVKNNSNLSTFYHIPENNKGFQIMLKSGWDKNKGLGPNADGRKFPVKTVLKKDRSCIGKSKEVPKITHFNANDETAVKIKSCNSIRIVREKTMKKWQRKKIDAINRCREIDFRRSFNTDF